MLNTIGSRFVTAGLVALLTATLYVRPAEAQLQPVLYGGTEWDAEDLQMFWAGAALQFARLGWSPWLGVFAYRLEMPANGTDETARGIVPAVGVRNQMAFSAFTFNVGYLFLDVEDEPGPPVVAGGRGGLVTGAAFDHWGGAWLTHANASYNWRDRYLWARAKSTRSLTGAPPASSVIRLGGEVVGQTGFRDDPYRAIQFGPMVEWQTSWGFLLGGAVGAKWDNRPFRDVNGTPYLKAEFAFVPPR